MRESQIKSKAKAKASKIFPEALILPIEDIFHHGYPDWLIIYKGNHIFIEWKTPEGIVSKMQEFTISLIKKSGGEAYVCRSVDDFIKILKERG